MNIDKAQKMVSNLVRERLAKVGGNAPLQGMHGRNLIKTLTAACGIQDVREMSAQKLEFWLQNAKLIKPAQVST